MKTFITFFLVTIFISPIFLQTIDKSKIKKTSRSDEKIIFVKVTKESNNHYINGFENGFELINGKKFKYNEFVNKTGTFLGKYRDNNEKFWLYKMDDGLYVRSKIVNSEKDSDYNNRNNNYFVFLKDLEILKNNFINKEVWLNKTDDFRFESYKTFISLSDDWWERFDKVKILEINTFYNSGQGNIWFTVVNDSDGKGRLKYDKTYDTGRKEGFHDYNYYLYNPLNPDWGDNIIKLIKNKQVQTGMTEYQVLVSWGKPNDINKTIHTNYISEQWVYDSYYSNSYLYFEGGLLKTIQN